MGPSHTEGEEGRGGKREKLVDDARLTMVWSSESEEDDNSPQAMMARYRKQQEQATFSAKNRISEETFDTADKTKYAKKKSKKPKWGGFSVWSSDDDSDGQRRQTIQPQLHRLSQLRRRG